MKFFCRECGKEIKNKPIILDGTDSDSLLFFKFRTGQNACVCEICWERYVENKQNVLLTLKETKQ